MDTIYLITSIILSAIGMLSIVASNDPQTPSWMSWVTWLTYTSAFFALFFAMETFGVAGAFTLWAAGTALLVTVQGARWGDNLSTQQTISITVTILGLIWFGLGG